MRQLIKIPGFLGLSNKCRLNYDQYEDLLAIESYINWAHNAGHSDITTRTRVCFDTFFDNTYDAVNPIMERKEAASKEHPHRPERYGENGEMRTAVSNRDAHMVAPTLDHTVSFIQALRSPKIRTQMARQLHHTDIRRILSVSHPKIIMNCADTCERGEGTDAQPIAHASSRHINMTVSSPSGHETPRNHTEALDLDRENGNSKWVDSENLELSRLKALEVTTVFPPHFAYTIKHDNRYKCRAVTGYPQPCAGEMSTVHRGANCGVAGNDTRLISHDFPECLIE